jgi:hypothetical protein
MPDDSHPSRQRNKSDKPNRRDRPNEPERPNRPERPKRRKGETKESYNFMDVRMPCTTHDLSVKVRPWEFGSSPM